MFGTCTYIYMQMWTIGPLACRRAVLPVEIKLGQGESDDEESNSEGSLHGYVEKINELTDDLFMTAKRNIG